MLLWLTYSKWLLSSSQTVDSVFLYFNFNFIFILFYFLIFLFLEHRVRVRSQDAENKVEGSRTNDVIQHRHHMLTSCPTHGCLSRVHSSEHGPSVVVYKVN